MPIVNSKYELTKKRDIPLYADPKSTQELFSVKSIDETGIFELTEGNYSKLYQLSDINFAGLTEGEQREIILNYAHLLNGLSCRHHLILSNNKSDLDELHNQLFFTKRGNNLDFLCDMFNEVIADKVSDKKQGIYSTIYLLLILQAENIRDARDKFLADEGILRNHFIQLGGKNIYGSELREVSINERMQMWCNFSHLGFNGGFNFDYEQEKAQQHDWKNSIAPESVMFYNDYFILNGSKYGRVMYVSDYANSLDSDFITKLMDIKCVSYISINSEILDVSTLQKETLRKKSHVRFSIDNEKKANRKNNDYLTDASDYLLSEDETLSGFIREIDSADSHFFNTTILIMFLADSKAELEELTEKFTSEADLKSFTLRACFSKQREGINSCFPFGVEEYKHVCNLSSYCLAMFMPFKTQELRDENGTWYGVNQLSQNIIRASRKAQQNYNGLVIGSMGGGKSMFAKSEILSNYVNHPNDQIIIVDPQNEYEPVVSRAGGATLSFDSTKGLYINPLDVDFEGVDYSGLQDIIGEESDFILTFLSSLMKRELTSEEEGILDDIVSKLFSENYALRKRLRGESTSVTEYFVPEYMKSKIESDLPMMKDLSNEDEIRAYSPLLQDIYQRLLDRNDPVSQKMAGYLMLTVDGSLNQFNHRTNCDISNRLTSIHIGGMKENLLLPSMLIMLKIIKDKIKANYKIGRFTWAYFDEFHELLGIEFVVNSVVRMWREVRKLGCSLTGITQNISDLLADASTSKNLELMVKTCEYYVLLNQSALDREKLLKLFPSVSPAMFSFVEGAPSGTGLLKIGNIAVPFDMRMDKTTELYKFINTDGVREAS